MSERLPNPEHVAPVKAVPVDDHIADNWLIAYQTGNSGEDGKDWALVTDNVRASALCFDYEFPGDAKHDAESMAAILNAYRTGRLVLAPTGLPTADAEIERLRHDLARYMDIANAEASHAEELRAREAELVGTLERWLDPYEGWARHELSRRADPATIEKIDRTRAILARVRTEKGETT